MSDAATEPRAKIGADKIILGAVALALLLAVALVFSQRQQALRSSASGLDGLRVWLSSEGIDAQNFLGGWPVPAEDVGLLVIPLYDTAPGQERVPPKTKEELVFQQDEYDLSWSPIWDKADMVPTVVVLPKWRSGMRLTKLAHPALVSPGEDIQRLGRTIVAGADFNFAYARTPFSEFTYAGADGQRLGAILYAAQTFSSSQCRPLVGSREAMVIGDCRRRAGDSASRVILVSDPDLVNNHGLTLGDNAFIVRDLVKVFANDKRVLVDYSRINWLTTGNERSDRERTWADLWRFFSPPFTLIWCGGLLVFALVLWRAGLRFGPAAAGLSRQGASKTMAIAARARLMLMSGRAGALAEDYMRARLATTASTIFGTAHARGFSSPESFLNYTRRRHPDHAPALTEALNTIQSLPPAATARHAMDVIDTLDTILETIAHDTRSAQRAR
ncbi:MAG: hypothetical protein AAFX45_07855 [Pseudomonadota bacterium]